MALFATLSFLDSGPAIWLLVGFIFLLPFFVRQYVTLSLLVVAIAAVAIPKSGTLWSPYYPIDFTLMPSPQGSSHPSAVSIVANHSWYQWVVDLLPAFLKSHPEAKPNSFLFPQYELPYEIVPSPKNVLILGAGTGNDVAAALRHGAEHIDAVELDPVILRLGKQYHPEHPYSSTNVTSHVDDARAFLKKSDRDVLVIDDWAMAPLSEPERRDFWEICEDRYSQSSSASLARTKSFTNSLSVSQSTVI